ncbi:winged helix-turn-helix transcriptional regulator [Methanospirillum lacunae]|uniref:Transcriptional regulator n=1 Tax=Methanospirillum lacunae TaxID=668570 RepID=A0A2V2N6L4_9EURY|nr:helix-turn-helix domain-containing protein [Methanospirillum lacunae]PWR70923.1 transcriptional regulator [Methanospirillum lacunae]
MNIQTNKPEKVCPVEVALNIIDGKWKLRILYFLQDRTLRYNEIQEKIPGITQKVLTSQLRQLEKDGILTRRAYAEIPPRVEYSLTPIGKKLITVYKALNVWALEYLDQELVRN